MNLTNVDTIELLTQCQIISRLVLKQFDKMERFASFLQAETVKPEPDRIDIHVRIGVFIGESEAVMEDLEKLAQTLDRAELQEDAEMMRDYKQMLFRKVLTAKNVRSAFPLQVG